MIRTNVHAPHVQSRLRLASLEATIIRADGTREERGVVSFYHHSAWQRLKFRLRRLLARGRPVSL